MLLVDKLINVYVKMLWLDNEGCTCVVSCVAYYTDLLCTVHRSTLKNGTYEWDQHYVTVIRKCCQKNPLLDNIFFSSKKV